MTSANELTLGALTSTELAARAGSWHLLIPLGSVEQHGPHLPLDTDARIAVAVAERAAKAVADAVVSPALPVSAAGEHAGFCGTLSIGTETTAEVLVELVRSAGPEWRSITVVNGHGGNLEAVRRAQQRCRAEGRELASWWPSDPGGDAHAGFTETSVMLALAPAAVRLEAAAPGVTEPVEELLAEMAAGGVAAVSPNGVLGDPRQSTAEAGQQILERWAGELIAVLSGRPPSALAQPVSGRERPTGRPSLGHGHAPPGPAQPAEARR